jgi:hypothetical protein
VTGITGVGLHRQSHTLDGVRHRVALGACVVGALASCYSYRPVSSPLSVGNTTIRIRYAPPQTLAATVGGRDTSLITVAAIEGAIQSMRGDTAIMGVSWIQRAGALREHVPRRGILLVVVPREGVRIDAPRVDAVKSVSALVLTALAVGLIYVAFVFVALSQGSG